MAAENFSEQLLASNLILCIPAAPRRENENYLLVYLRHIIITKELSRRRVIFLFQVLCALMIMDRIKTAATSSFPYTLLNNARGTCVKYVFIMDTRIIRY